jgi:diguanylate cyclase (GGDEF)-like protein
MAWLEDIGPPAAEALLEPLILRDQLAAVRRASITALQVHVLLGLITVIVAIHSGYGDAGLAWFAVCVVTGLLRVIPNFVPLTTISDHYGSGGRGTVQGHLHLISMTALASGIVWSLVPVLCAGYTSPNAVYYLTVVSGIAAGGVANSTAYARVAICFLLPPLLSIAFCLVFYSGDFDRYCLAAVACLYIAELIQISRRSEAAFRDSSRLKNAATTLAQSLTEANAQALAVADQMRFRATHDDLTGLLNRSGFMQQVNLRLAALPSPLCLMVLDLDGFKSVNDLFGHQTGDEVLIEVARRLREVLPDQFVVARIGGDEFAIFYALDATSEPAAALATRLINIMDVPFTNFDAGRIGASIGIYVAAQATQVAMIAEMLTYADEALYAAKNTGRSRYFLFDDSLRLRRDMRRAVERDLRHALSDRALQVWYQPVFGQDGKALVSLEALLRWEHPNFGWVPPEDLLAIAAITGLSELLIEFILAEVCVMIQNLISLRLEHIWVAMNLSPREVSRIGIDELVLAKLTALALSPAMLEIEITEETAMNTRPVQEKLNRLANAGVRIAVDDFGVGYSSLASLRNLQVNRIKIDRCFVTGISASDSDQILVQAILKLGQSLGIEVVAEGVETAADLDLLQALGCERVQGYYLKSPAPRAQTLDWLQTMHAAQSSQLQS